MIKKSGQKKWLIIAVILIVAAIAAGMYFFKGDASIEGEDVDAAVTSNAEASARLTAVAGDITSFKEELDSLTRGFTNPAEAE